MNSIFPSYAWKCRAKVGGFTLLEMVITLGIFVLLCASVFGILTGVLQGTASLQANQDHHDQIERLNAFLKKKLKDLPAESTVISYRRGEGEGLNQNGIIFGQDQQLTAIDAKQQANGYYMLRIANFDPSTMPPNVVASPTLIFETDVTNDTRVVWTPLIKDIAKIEWKFQQLNVTDWMDAWSDPGNTPNLIEFSIQQATSSRPTIMDFWLPRLLSAKNNTGGNNGNNNHNTNGIIGATNTVPVPRPPRQLPPGVSPNDPTLNDP